MLRSLIRYDSAASAVASAIAQIRSRFREPLLVVELARDIGMSVSAFHRHFRAVTASSPLQYQKDLRLLEGAALVLLGSATEILQPAVQYPVQAGARSVTTADFNGDGKLDLATAKARRVCCSGLGTVRSGLPRAMPSPWSPPPRWGSAPPRAISTGDGAPDLAVTTAA